MSNPATPHARPAAPRAVALVVAVTALMIALSSPAASGGTQSACAAETTSSAECSPSAEASMALPARMAYVGDARQLIVVTGRKIGSRTGTLRFYELAGETWVCSMTVPAKFGARGLVDGNRRRAGTKTTPTGIWKMPGFVFGYAKRAPTGAKMKYRRITARSWWSSKRGSSYNQWKSARRWPGEHLYRVVPQYEYAVSVGYNARPNRVKYGRGTAIFLHVRGRGYTAGCVAISRRDMFRVSRLLDPAKKPACAIGTLQTGTSTSIWAY